MNRLDFLLIQLRAEQKAREIIERERANMEPEQQPQPEQPMELPTEGENGTQNVPY